MLSLYLQMLESEEERSRFARLYLTHRDRMFHAAMRLLVTDQREDGDCIFFETESMQEGVTVTFGAKQGEVVSVETVTIHGLPGEFHRSLSEDEQSNLIWMDEEAGLFFEISARQDAAVILHIAESVSLVKSLK